MKYGLVLKEKQLTDGLTKDEINELFDLLDEPEAYPIELEPRAQECSAMGFISVAAAEHLFYDYERSGLHDFIANILDDVENESADGTYEFMGIQILLTR